MTLPQTAEDKTENILTTTRLSGVNSGQLSLLSLRGR